MDLGFCERCARERAGVSDATAIDGSDEPLGTWCWRVGRTWGLLVALATAFVWVICTWAEHENAREHRTAKAAAVAVKSRWSSMGPHLEPVEVAR